MKLCRLHENNELVAAWREKPCWASVHPLTLIVYKCPYKTYVIILIEQAIFNKFYNNFSNKNTDTKNIYKPERNKTQETRRAGRSNLRRAYTGHSPVQPSTDKDSRPSSVPADRLLRQLRYSSMSYKGPGHLPFLQRPPWVIQQPPSPPHSPCLLTQQSEHLYNQVTSAGKLSGRDGAAQRL
jgi:hypothetical protein